MSRLKTIINGVSRVFEQVALGGSVGLSGKEAGFVVAEIRDGVSNALFTKVLAAAAVIHPGTDTWVIDGNTSTNGREFTIAQGVQKLIVTATPVTAFTAGTESNEYVDVVIDAGNGALAKSIFDEALTDVVDATHAYLRIPFNQRIELPISEDIITRVDFKPTSIAKILVEGY